MLVPLLEAPNWNGAAGAGADAAGAFDESGAAAVLVDVLPNEKAGAFAAGSDFFSAVPLPLAPNWNAGAGAEVAAGASCFAAAGAAVGGLVEVDAGVCPKVNAGVDDAGAAVDVEVAVEGAGFDTSTVGFTRFRLKLRNSRSSRCSLSRLSSILVVCHAPTRGCLTVEP